MIFLEMIVSRKKSLVRDVREETPMSRFVTEYADCDVDNYTLIFKI